jgi:HNH endonuclease
MLKRAENVSMGWSSHWRDPSKYGMWVWVDGNFHKVKITEEEFERLRDRQKVFPVLVLAMGDRNLWLFQDRYYWHSDRLDAEDVHALLVAEELRLRQKIARAREFVATGAVPRERGRVGIPDDVKRLVWQRDGGRCCSCGSNIELQFDHVIPVAMGGASTPENLQILCGPCNRAKGADLTVQ